MFEVTSGKTLKVPIERIHIKIGRPGSCTECASVLAMRDFFLQHTEYFDGEIVGPTAYGPYKLFMEFRQHSSDDHLGETYHCSFEIQPHLRKWIAQYDSTEGQEMDERDGIPEVMLGLYFQNVATGLTASSDVNTIVGKVDIYQENSE